MVRFSSGFQWLSAKLMVVGALLLLLMVGLTCVDVIGRMFGHPVFGAYELMSFMAALVAAAALPDTHLEKRHIGVEIITNKLPGKIRLLLELLTNSFACVIFGIASWRIFALALKVKASGEVSMNLEAPEYLVMAAVGAGFFLFFIAIILSLITTFKKLFKR